MSRSEAPIYEHEIQRIWAEQDFDSSGLKTFDGKKIEVRGCDVYTFKDGKISLKNSLRKQEP